MPNRMKGFFRGTLTFLAAATLLSGCAMKLGKQPREEVAPLYSAASPQFRQSAGSLLGPNFVSGNNITTLINGDQIFPAMLSTIRSARRSVNLETYVYWDGVIAKEFTQALAERARAGVHVNLILDAQGSRKIGRENRKQLADAGAQIVNYHSGFWPDPAVTTIAHIENFLLSMERPPSSAAQESPIFGRATRIPRNIGATIITK